MLKSLHNKKKVVSLNHNQILIKTKTMTKQELHKRLKLNDELLTFSNEKNIFDIGILDNKIWFQINGKSQPKRNNFGKFWTLDDILEIIKDNNLQLEEL